jgi:hypothetical protein
MLASGRGVKCVDVPTKPKRRGTGLVTNCYHCMAQLDWVGLHEVVAGAVR